MPGCFLVSLVERSDCPRHGAHMQRDIADERSGIPVSYYRTFVIEQQFGFNKMTPRMFLLDLVKRAVLGMLFGIPLLLGVLWLMEKMGANWWFYAWLAWMGFNLVVLAIYPDLDCAAIQ